MEAKNKVKTLEVSAESQKKILAMMLYDKTFLESYKGLMKPEYFDYQVLSDMAKNIIGFFEKYSRIPTEDEFLDELDAFISKNKKRNKNFPAEEYFPIAEEVLKMGKEGDFNYTRDKVVAFVKRQAMNQAMIEIPKKLKMEDYEGIVLSVQEAARVGDADEAIHLKEINLEEVEPESVSWLWMERIPEGKLTYVVGDPGVGKSFLMASFMKYVTTEEGWPEYEHAPKKKGSVILLNAEDGLADTIVRRLQWAGADRSKVTFVEATIERNGEERLFKLDRDIPKLEESIKAKKDVKLIVIDPLSAYLGKVDSHKDSDIRGILAPLARMAEKYKVAVVAVLHLNKRETVQAIYRVPGSIGFAGVARVIWYVAEDKENEGRRLFSVLKNNLSPKAKCDLGMAFKIKEGVVGWEDLPMRKTAEEILKEQERLPRRKKRDEAIEFLKEILANGPVAQPEIKEMAEDEDFSWRTVRYAKKELGVESDREGGKTGKWFWKLPEGLEEKKPEEEEEETNLNDEDDEIEEKRRRRTEGELDEDER